MTPQGFPALISSRMASTIPLTDLLKQELPENESRQHTETVSLAQQE